MAAQFHITLSPIPAEDTDLLAYDLGPATAVIALAAGNVAVVYNNAPGSESKTRTIVFSGAGEGRGVIIDKIKGTGDGSSAIAIEVYWDVSGS